MNLLKFLPLLLTYGHCQFVFPDQFEPTNNPIIYGEMPQRRLPFPTLSAAAISSISKDIPASNYNGFNHEATPPPSAPAATINNGLFTLPPLAEPITIFNRNRNWNNYVNNILADSVTRFALRLSRAINQTQTTLQNSRDQNNIVFSPMNIVSTLAIILIAAAGRTFNETANILDFDIGLDISRHSEIIHQIFGTLLTSIEADLKDTIHQTITYRPETFIAGGIFIQDGYPIRPEFQAIAENIYKNNVITVNFQRESMVARDIINDFVKSKTHGKIHDILTEVPDENVKIILASALFFNGDWNQHFIKGATRRKSFSLRSGQTINIDMMYNGGSFPFYEDKQLGVKILGLPYKNSHGNSSINDYVNIKGNNDIPFQTTMYVLLPTSSNVNAMDNLQLRLSSDIIDQLISQMKIETCIIGIPRMKLSSTMNLNHAFQLLGLTSLFNPTIANLGLLSSGLSATQFNSLNDNPVIFSRLNADESTTEVPDKLSSEKKNYIRYEDLNGGYLVEQWNSGVYLKKIHRLNRKRRRTSEYIKYNNRNNTNNINSVKAIRHMHNDSVRKMKRDKRQNRLIIHDFMRFIESRRYQLYGLDALRNSGNLINPGLYASDVIHKVEIDVTETGTVAAAATAVIIRRDGNQKRLIANRPFLFFIRHDPKKLILFWAIVNKPTPNYD